MEILAAGLPFLIFVAAVVGFLILRDWIRRLQGDISVILNRLRKLEHQMESQQEEPKTHAAPAASAAPPPVPAIPPVPAKTAPFVPPAAKHSPPLVAHKRPAPVSDTAADTSRQPDFWSNLEEMAGKRWMTWLGALAVIASVVFFIGLAIERGWLGPEVLIILGILAGVGLLVLGERLLKQAKSALGQGIIGCGLALLYVSLYAALEHDLLSRPIAFCLLCGAAACVMALAVIRDGLPIALLATIGAFLAPLIVSTGADSRDLLFGYLTFVNLAVLGVVFFKRWRILTGLAYTGTAILFSAWSFEYYEHSVLQPTLIWISVFYLMYLVLPFALNLRERTQLNVRHILMSFSLALGTFGYVIGILWRYDGARTIASLVMALFYIVVFALCRRRIPHDRRAQICFSLLASFLMVLGWAFYYEGAALLAIWSLQAIAMLLAGWLLDFRPIRIQAMLVMILPVIFTLCRHLPSPDIRYTAILNKDFGTAILAPSAAMLFAVMHHLRRRSATGLDTAMKNIAAIGGGAVATVVLHCELISYLEMLQRYNSPMLGAQPSYLGCVLLWTLASAVFMAAGLKLKAWTARAASVALCFVAFVFAVIAYNASDPHLLLVNALFLLTILPALLILSHAKITSGGRMGVERHRGIAFALYAMGAFAFLALFSVEAYSHFERARGAVDGGRAALTSLSVVWALYAAALVAIGFVLHRRAPRIFGLALFIVTALKVSFVDLAGLDQIYRVVSLVVLGLLMLVASYLYHTLEKLLNARTAGE